MWILASVSVPVLSVQSTSIEPRSWIALWRLTIICRRAMRSAPRASVTDTIIGSSSGVRPTASAIANRKDSSHGLCMKTLTSSTNSTISTVSRMISMPKRRVPISNAVGSAGRLTLSAMSPIAVAVPVRTTRMLALPLTTEEPMKTALVAPSRSVASASGRAACFSTGYGSPVSSAWLTKKSRVTSTTPSAGVRSPAASSTRSPGTSCATGSSWRCPSRTTLALTVTDWRSLSAAALARDSCTKSSVTLSSTMTAMIAKSVVAPLSADTPLAPSRISTSGLRKCDRNSSQGGVRRCSTKWFGP